MKDKSLLAAAMLLFSTASLAVTPEWLADFHRADLNDSGGLSKVELGKTGSKQLDVLRASFDAIDADKDGHVTTAEYEAHVSRKSARTQDKQTARANLSPDWLAEFHRADLNDSGGLSKVELGKSGSRQLDAMRTHFDGIDADRDGHVTLAEYENWQARQTVRLSDKQFARADLNDSGGLSRPELDKSPDKSLDAIRQNFDRIDRDRDGHVTYAEYLAFADAGAATQAGATAYPVPGGQMAPVGQAQQTPRDQCQPNCGRVLSVDHFKTKGEGSALGAIAGGVAGGVLGNQVGDGTTKKVATLGGAAGGAYLGHQLEAKLRTKKMVRVAVRFDNGEQKDFEFEGETSPLAVGDRVQMINGVPTKYAGL